LTTGEVSASSVVNHTDPHHTPSAPRANAAAIWRRGDPARGQHRKRIDGIHYFGDQNHGRHLAVWAAGLGALRDDQVDTAAAWSPRVLRVPASAATSTSLP